MEKIIEAFKGHVRVNDSTKDIEIFDAHGVKMRLKVDEETLKSFKEHFPSF